MLNGYYLLTGHLLVRPQASFRPGLHEHKSSRAVAVRDGRSSRSPAGLVLDGREHDDMIECVGLEGYAFFS
jgi:hypothetical protein